MGGLHSEIQRIREMVELQLVHPELFKRLGIEPPKGVFLYGPPGCGKTLLAKAVANESDANFYVISGPEIMSKFYGESEARLREIFQKAQETAPSIIFIDEMDAIAPKREEVTGEVERRVVAQLLSLMDGMGARGNIIVIGATNRPNAIDPALRRPGRFDREIEIGVPDKMGRYEVLQIHTRTMPLASDVGLPRLSDICHGYTGADISALCREAAMKALRRYLPEINLEEERVPSGILEKMEVNLEDFMNAYREITPKAMREVFRKGRTAAPSIIFFDELDSVVPRRGTGFGDSGVSERVISQLLTELDGIESLENVVVIGATNRPDIIDPAILRPGRFDRLIFVPAPDHATRMQILKIHCTNMPLSQDVDLDHVASQTGGYSGADLEAVVREAGPVY